MIPLRTPAFALASLALVSLALAGCGGRAQVVSAPDPGTPDPAAEQLGPKGQVPAGLFRHRGQTPFEQLWDLQFPKPIASSWTCPQLPELVFFETTDHVIYAVDAMSGSTKWATQALPAALNLPAFGARVSVGGTRIGTATNDDRLYVISDDVLFCFDAVGGQLIWRFNLPFSPSTGPLAHGTEGDLRVFIGDWAGHLRVISIDPARNAPYEVWQWTTGDAISATPVEKDDLVYVGDHGGHLRCFGLDREQNWVFPAGTGITTGGAPVGGAIEGGATVRDRVVYFGNRDHVLYALNRLTGETLGQLNFNGPILRAPFWFNDDADHLYFWIDSKDPNANGLYSVIAQPDRINFADNTRPAIDVVRFATAWHVPAVNHLVSSTPQHLFCTAGNSSVVLAIRRTDGHIDWAWDAAEDRLGKDKHANLSSITEYQDQRDALRAIITCDDKGGVIAYRFYGYVPRNANEALVAAPAPEEMPLDENGNPEMPAMPKSHKAATDAAAAPAPADK